MSYDGETLSFDMRLNIENFIAGIDQTAIEDTNAAPEAAKYDALRALEPADLEAQFAEYWPQMAAKITVLADGEPVTVQNPILVAGPVGDTEVTRASNLTFTAPGAPCPAKLH